MTDTAAVLHEAAEAMRQRDDEDVLDMAEAAAMVRRPIETLRYWRQHGTGPKSFKIGRRVAYRRGAVRAWIAEQEAQSA